MEHFSSTQIHTMHREWLSLLNFFQDEIKYFQNLLAETAAKNKEESRVADLKNYQQNFLEKLRIIDEIRHNIHLNEYYLAYFKEQHLQSGKVIEPDNDKIKVVFEDFSKQYKHLKEGFQNFIVTMR